MRRYLLWLGCGAALAAGCAHGDPDAALDYEHDGRRVGDLLRDAGSPDEAVRDDAFDLLSRFGLEDKPALPALIRAVNEDENPNVRSAATRAMSRIKPPTRESEGAMMKALTDKNPTVSRNAIASARILFQQEAPQPTGETPPTP
jgi:HEAT repeat protein